MTAPPALLVGGFQNAEAIGMRLEISLAPHQVWEDNKDEGMPYPKSGIVVPVQICTS